MAWSGTVMSHVVCSLGSDPSLVVTTVSGWWPPRNSKLLAKQCSLHMWAINLACAHCLSNFALEIYMMWLERTPGLTSMNAQQPPCSASFQHSVEWGRSMLCPMLHSEGGTSNPLLPWGASFKKFHGQPWCGSSKKCLCDVAQFGNMCVLEKGLWKCTLKATVTISPAATDTVEFENLEVQLTQHLEAQLTHDLLSLAISASETLTRQSSLARFVWETCSDEAGMDSGKQKGCSCWMTMLCACENTAFFYHRKQHSGTICSQWVAVCQCDLGFMSATVTRKLGVGSKASTTPTSLPCRMRQTCFPLITFLVVRTKLAKSVVFNQVWWQTTKLHRTNDHKQGLRCSEMPWWKKLSHPDVSPKEWMRFCTNLKVMSDWNCTKDIHVWSISSKQIDSIWCDCLHGAHVSSLSNALVTTSLQDHATSWWNTPWELNSLFLWIVPFESCILFIGMHSSSGSVTRVVTLILGLNHGWNRSFVIDKCKLSTTERDPAGTLTGAGADGTVAVGATGAGAKGDEKEGAAWAWALKRHGDSWFWTDLALPPVPPQQSSTSIRFLLFLTREGIAFMVVFRIRIHNLMRSRHVGSSCNSQLKIFRTAGVAGHVAGHVAGGVAVHVAGGVAGHVAGKRRWHVANLWSKMKRTKQEQSCQEMMLA